MMSIFTLITQEDAYDYSTFVKELSVINNRLNKHKPSKNKNTARAKRYQILKQYREGRKTKESVMAYVMNDPVLASYWLTLEDDLNNIMKEETE